MGQSYSIYACTRANHARYLSVHVTFFGGHRVKYGLDQWTFGPFFGLLSKPALHQKVIFRVSILLIYGTEEGGNGNMKMAPNIAVI